MVIFFFRCHVSLPECSCVNNFDSENLDVNVTCKCHCTHFCSSEGVKVTNFFEFSSLLWWFCWPTVDASEIRRFQTTDFGCKKSLVNKWDFNYLSLNLVEDLFQQQHGIRLRLHPLGMTPKMTAWLPHLEKPEKHLIDGKLVTCGSHVNITVHGFLQLPF